MIPFLKNFDKLHSPKTGTNEEDADSTLKFKGSLRNLFTNLHLPATIESAGEKTIEAIVVVGTLPVVVAGNLVCKAFSHLQQRDPPQVVAPLLEKSFVACHSQKLSPRLFCHSCAAADNVSSSSFTTSTSSMATSMNNEFYSESETYVPRLLSERRVTFHKDSKVQNMHLFSRAFYTTWDRLLTLIDSCRHHWWGLLAILIIAFVPILMIVIPPVLFVHTIVSQATKAIVSQLPQEKFGIRQLKRFVEWIRQKWNSFIGAGNQRARRRGVVTAVGLTMQQVRRSRRRSEKQALQKAKLQDGSICGTKKNYNHL